jgi:hypothetical protein
VVHTETVDGCEGGTASGDSDDPDSVCLCRRELESVSSLRANMFRVRIGWRESHAGHVGPLEVVADLNAQVPRKPAAIRKHGSGCVGHTIDGVLARPDISPEALDSVLRLILFVQIILACGGMACSNLICSFARTDASVVSALADSSRTGDQGQVGWRFSVDGG